MRWTYPSVLTRTLFVVFECTLLAVTVSCGHSLPETEHESHRFPEESVYLGKPKRAFSPIGTVREKVSFDTLDPRSDGDKLCRNYYNQAVNKLLKMARKNGGEAVIQVRSVVLMADGRMERFVEPECYDDGADGQVAVEGTAIRWKPSK